MPTVKTYIVAQGRGPVIHNGDRFDDGDEIALAAEHVPQLLAVDAIFDPADLDGDGTPDVAEARAARKRKAKAADAE